MFVNKGFTMLELMITLSIGAILATVAAPSYQSMMVQSRLSTQSNEFLTALHYSRSEAIKRGIRVTMCKSNSGIACTNGSSWQDGWIVYSDSETAGEVGKVDGSDEVLRVFPGMIGSTMTASNYTNWISYLPNGSSKSSDNLSNGSFTVCNSAQGRKINVNTTGRPYVEKLTSC